MTNNINGWKIDIREDESQTWLTITGPRAEACAFAVERGSVRAQVLQQFAADLTAEPSISSSMVGVGTDKPADNRSTSASHEVMREARSSWATVTNAPSRAPADPLREALAAALKEMEHANRVMLASAGVGVCDLNTIASARAAIAAPAPSGYALVPLRPTPAMQAVMRDGEWEWADLLAAANAVTETEYEALAVPAPQQAADEVWADIERALTTARDDHCHAELDELDCDLLLGIVRQRAAPAPQPLPEHADHADLIAIRLRRLARAIGCPATVPEDDETAVGGIFTVLGRLAGHAERAAKLQGVSVGCPTVTDAAVQALGSALAKQHAVYLTAASARRLLAEVLAATPKDAA